jgi:type IV pilus assembly protein PilA
MIRRIRKQLNKKGFTLVELIAVLAILAIVAAIAIPSFNTTVKNSQIKADIATAAQIGRAAELYYIELGSPEDMPEIDLTETATGFVAEYLNGNEPVCKQDSNVDFTVELVDGKAIVNCGDATYFENGSPITFEAAKLPANAIK